MVTDRRTDGRTKDDFKLPKKAKKAKKQKNKIAKKQKTDGRTDIVAYRVACTRLKTLHE